VLTTAIAANGL